MDLDRIHKALRCKANVHAMSEALSQKLDIHAFLTANASAQKIPAYDPSEQKDHEPKTDLSAAKDIKAPLSSRPSLARQGWKN